MVTIYHHWATYFLFPSTILGDKASGWLKCAAHGMHDITHESMWSREELKNESEMTLELFGVVKQLAMTSYSPTARLDGDTTQAAPSSSKNPTTPPSKRRHLNSEWAEGCANGKPDNENGAMFCEWCRTLLQQKWAQEQVCEGMCINEAWEHMDLEPGLSQIQTVQPQKVT